MTKTKFRITGVLLTIAILLATFSSFAIPAFAAESEPIISGGNEGEVSGNFNPEIAFTDINVIDEEDIVYYEKDGVYIVVILPDKSAADFPNMQLVGTNLEYLDKDNVLLQVKSSVYASYGDYYKPDFIEPLEYLIEENFLLYNWSGMRDGSWTEYCYSNDGGNTWSDVIRFEAKQSYTITNDTSDTNGTVTIPSYSVAGETVNVDVSPTYGYRLDTLTVTDAKGNPVIVENKAFTMPTSAVTVNAVFAVCDHSSNQHVEFDDKGDMHKITDEMDINRHLNEVVETAPSEVKRDPEENYLLTLDEPSENWTFGQQDEPPIFSWTVQDGIPQEFLFEIDYLNDGTYLTKNIVDRTNYKLSNEEWETIINNTPIVDGAKTVHWRVRIDYVYHTDLEPYYTNWGSFNIANE